MDVIMKKDDFYFLNKPYSTQAHTGKSTMRSKTSSHKEKHSNYPESRFFESREDARFGMNSTRGHVKRHPHLTGINTYLYEVLAVPLRESFMNSIEKRKRVVRNSLKEYDRFGDRSKSKMLTYEFKKSKINAGKIHPNNFQRSENFGIVHNDSIFDNLPERIKPKISTSVDESRKAKNF
jgi:hypothetical protein